MAYCGKCGTRLFEGLDRCQKCGAPVKFNNIKPGYSEPINSESSNSYVPYNTQSVQITSSDSPKNKFTLLKILMIIVLIMIFACVSILGYFIYSYFSLKNYAAKAAEELKENQVIVLNELVEKSEVPFKVSEEVETLYVKQVKVSYEEVTFPVSKETEINYEITRPDLKEYFETLEVAEIETQEEFDKQLSDEIEMAEPSIVTLPVRFEHEPMKKWDTENTIEYLVSVDADETVKDIIPVTTNQVVTESSNLVTTKQTKTTMKIEKSTEKNTEKPVISSDPYLSIVQDYQAECRNQSYPYTYMIDDLNKDGQLDLIVRTGDCEANYMFVLWTVNSNGDTVKVGEMGGWHTSLYGSYSKSVAYINMCGQGVQTILKYDINGSSGIQETNLFNRQLTMEQETTYGYYNMTSDADIYRLEEKNITEYQYKESRKIKDSDTSMTLEEYIEMIDGLEEEKSFTVVVPTYYVNAVCGRTGRTIMESNYKNSMVGSCTNITSCSNGSVELVINNYLVTGFKVTNAKPGELTITGTSGTYSSNDGNPNINASHGQCGAEGTPDIFTITVMIDEDGNIY